MLNTFPYNPPFTTPQDVALYLQEQGWMCQKNGNNNEYWQSINGHGFYTWEQALIYLMWKRFHLGAV